MWLVANAFFLSTLPPSWLIIDVCTALQMHPAVREGKPIDQGTVVQKKQEGDEQAVVQISNIPYKKLVQNQSHCLGWSCLGMRPALFRLAELG